MRHGSAVSVVAAAGAFWSTGPVFVKAMHEPARYIREYLFVRMATLVLLYALYLRAYLYCYRAGRRRASVVALLCLSRLSPAWRAFGVLGLACAMAGFVVSLTMVPAAMTLCELAASPFFAALLGRVMLGNASRKSPGRR